MIAPSHGVYVIEVCDDNDAKQDNTAMLLKETVYCYVD